MTTTETDPASTAELPPADRGGDARRQVRATARAFRPRRSVPAAIVAAVLAILAILAAIEVISRFFDRQARVLPVDRLTELGRDNRWDGPLALTVSAVLAALGLLLLLIALWRSRGRVVPLAVDAPELVAGITSRGLGHDAAATAREVPGVTGATAKSRGRRLRVRVDTALREPEDLAGQVEQAVTERLDLLGPLTPVRTSVAVRQAKGVR